MTHDPDLWHLREGHESWLRRCWWALIPGMLLLIFSFGTQHLVVPLEVFVPALVVGVGFCLIRKGTIINRRHGAVVQWYGVVIPMLRLHFARAELTYVEFIYRPHHDTTHNRLRLGTLRRPLTLQVGMGKNELSALARELAAVLDLPCYESNRWSG